MNPIDGANFQPADWRRTAGGRQAGSRAAAFPPPPAGIRLLQSSCDRPRVALVHHLVSGVICPAAFHSLVYDRRDTQNVGTFLFALDDLAGGGAARGNLKLQ